jgi:hypothetical protein
MFDAARRRGRRLMAAQHHRFDAAAQAIKEVVDSGALGEIYYSSPPPTPPASHPGAGSSAFLRRGVSWTAASTPSTKPFGSWVTPGRRRIRHRATIRPAPGRRRHLGQQCLGPPTL